MNHRHYAYDQGVGVHEEAEPALTRRGVRSLQADVSHPLERSIMLRHLAASAVLLLTLLTAPAAAAQSKGWTAKLDGFTQLAKAAHQAGNVDGAKSVILAGLPTFLSIMQQNALHIPRNKQAAEGFNAAAEAIYQGHPVADDTAAFQKVLAEYRESLLAHAEVMHTPNGSARNQLAMLLQAQQQQAEITARVVAYVKGAPGPAAHMKEPAAKEVVGAVSTIITALSQMQPRGVAVLKEATAKGGEVMSWAEGSLSKGDLFQAMAHARRAGEIGEGMLALDKANETGKSFVARATAVKETVAKKYAAQVAKNRMPSSGFKGGAGQGKKLMALYKKTFPKEKPVKLVIVSPDWKVESRADWSERDKRWTFTRYKMLSEVVVSVARKDGKRTRYWVNFMRAFKVWNGKAYGATQITPIGGWMPYEVLPAHAK